MRKVALLFLSATFITATFATSTIEVKPVPNANTIMLPVGKSGQQISLMELSKISIADFETLTGKKLKFVDRLVFKTAQKKLRKNIAEDGTLKKKNFQKAITRWYEGATGFHLGGFALGFFLGIIGVLIAYLIKDDYKKNRVKWAWIGLASWLLIWVVLFVIILDVFSYDTYW